jgi:cytochrome c peroxidase
MLYESTLVSDNSPFNQYVNGDITAMTTQQVTGFQSSTGTADASSATRARSSQAPPPR